MWVGRCWWYEMINKTVLISTQLIYRFIDLLKSSSKSDLVNSPLHGIIKNIHQCTILSPVAVLTSKWGWEAEQWYFLVEWSEPSSSEDHTEMMRSEHKTYRRPHEMLGLKLHLTPVHRGVGYSTTRLRLIPHEGPSCLTSVSLWPFTLQRDIPSMLHSSPSWKISSVFCFIVQIFNFWFHSL